MVQSACPHLSPQHVELQDSLSERIQYLAREKVRRGLSREFTKRFTVYQYEYGEQNVHLDGRTKVYISQAFVKDSWKGKTKGDILQILGQDFPNLRYTQDINEGIRTIPPAILAFYVCKFECLLSPEISSMQSWYTQVLKVVRRRTSAYVRFPTITSRLSGPKVHGATLSKYALDVY
eukprot:jgi/Picre1/32400/NNA_007746.t1